LFLSEGVTGFLLLGSMEQEQNIPHIDKIII